MSFLLRLLRLRYLIFGTAVGGGLAARKVYQQFFKFFRKNSNFFVL